MGKSRLNFVYLILGLIVVVCSMTVAFSAFTTELKISNDATFRVVTDIRIAGIELIEATNGALIEYDAQYNTTELILGFSLPNLDSTIKYKITVNNIGNVEMQLKEILEESMSNENITYEIEGIEVNDIIEGSNTVKTFLITFKYKDTVEEIPDDIILNSRLAFNFEEAKRIRIGDYVDYTYDINDDTREYDLPKTVSGDRSDQTILQTEGLKWRIYSFNEDGSVDLISDVATTSRAYFRGALGYNNGVYVINDICKKQYSNESLGIIARSIRIEDVEKSMNEDGLENRYVYTNGTAHFEDVKTYTGKYSYYPVLYANENGSGIDTTELKEDGIGTSDPFYNEPTTETFGQASTNGLTVKQSFYSLGNTIPTNYFYSIDLYDILFKSGSAYWLGSRYTFCRKDYVDFEIFCVSGTYMTGYNMFSSRKSEYGYGYYIRPIVTIGGDLQIEECEGQNDITNMHKIVPKQ